MIAVHEGEFERETHYYPFGLPMGDIGSAAVGFTSNRRKYQGNEYIKDAGLNWMDFNARQYDPKIGRFLSVDPMAASKGQDRFSPYAAMGDEPAGLVGADISIYPNSPISNGFDLEVESGGYLNAAGLSIIGIGVGIFSSPISFTPASWLQFAP